MDRYETLFEKLKAYAASGALPMHMPGHKRNPFAPYLRELGAGLDLTEIQGFDNLHQPEGVLLKAQERAAELWGAKESHFLVNGSTCGILAGLYALTRRGDELLLARGSHSSAYHGVELLGLTPRFLLPPLVPGREFFASVTPEAVSRALGAYPGVKALLITSPTYEGVLSDIRGIAQACHQRGAALLVDEAHGAHLGLGGGFPEGAVKAGADLVVQSLHKTLPSLTQTAILHVNGDRVDRDRLRHALSLFQTSSPSYLLMASLDGCVSLLLERPELLSQWMKNLERFEAETAELRRIAFPLRGELPKEVFGRDPGKLLLAAEGLSGYRLSGILREEYSIELEMAAGDYALAMTGPGDTEETFHRLARALKELDRRLPELRPNPGLSPLPYGLLPETVLPPGEAVDLPRGFLPTGEAAGQTSAEYVWAYPPGIPLLIPGERVSPELAQAAASGGGRLHSTYGRLPGELAVLTE